MVNTEGTAAASSPATAQRQYWQEGTETQGEMAAEGTKDNRHTEKTVRNQNQGMASSSY